MENKIKLEVIGITFNQIESGVYALILQQVGSTRRIPIIIGFPEAQAIECKLQEIKTPRPLTHDIMVRALQEYDIFLDYILIKKLPNGVFAADLYFTDGNGYKIVDARSSDAVALALRTKAPIYTTEDVLIEAGFDPSDKKAKHSQPNLQREKSGETKIPSGSSLENLSITELIMAMEKAAADEDYEQAARIKQEINRRNNG